MSDSLSWPGALNANMVASPDHRRNFGLYRHPKYESSPMDAPSRDDADESEPSWSEVKTSYDMETYDPLLEEVGFDPNDFPAAGTTGEEEDGEDERAEAERQRIRDEIDARTGRLWTDPWEITDDDWMSGAQLDDLPDWNVGMCSRVSMERVKVHPDGVPTISALASLPLPPPPPPQPGHGHTRAYAAERKRQQYEQICAAVSDFAEQNVERILNLSTWEEKQDAVDELFENVEQQMIEKEHVLGSLPNFSQLVERALEEFLAGVRAREKEMWQASRGSLSKDEAETTDASSETGHDDEDGKLVLPSEADDKKAKPVFVDLLGSKKSSDDEGAGDGNFLSNVNDTGVPNFVYPLQSHPKDGIGRMVEEWDLSANKATKRIMLRQCTREIARLVAEADSHYETKHAPRVYVHGARGAGKTATLATVVAAARASGHIALYLPDGDRLRKHGYYLEPSSHRRGLFDLPILTKEVCTQLLASHGDDMSGLNASQDCMKKFFTDEQIRRVLDREAEQGSSDVNEVPLANLLKIGSESNNLSTGCYSSVIETLMNQTTKPFIVAMDEFNCYYDHGHYFHEEYDEHVRKAVPCDQITLFKPLLDAMGISTHGKDSKKPMLMKRGAIIVATSESRAVKREFTDALSASARETAAHDNCDPVHSIEVPRFSPLEVEHIIANFEIIGIGRLRFDRGDTVMNEQEVAYLRMVSGGYGQLLLDACIV